MGKRIDLLGQRFGRLTVISYSETRNKKAYWKCLCDCGNEKITYVRNLLSGDTKSCGCYHRECCSERRLKDLTGQVFGRLTVISQSEGRKRGQLIWNCRCVCGNIITVPSGSLTNGNTSSCGCLHLETIQKDLTGQRFGKLTVMSMNNTRALDGELRWNCLCDCGKSCAIKGKSLRTGHTKSCGCYQKEIQRKLRTTHGLCGTSAYKDLQLLISSGRDILDSGWSRKMDKALKKLQPICVVCGSNEKLAIDHVLPFSKGYGLKPGNAVRLCNRCNSKKWNRDLNKLPEDMKNRILKAAKEFEDYWNGQ